MNFDVSVLNASKNDKKRNIKIPTEMTNELAEDIGIQIGDGCLNNIDNDYQIVCSGNYLEEKKYIENHIFNLKKSLFGIDPKLRKIKNEYRIYIRSKAIFEFYTKIIGLPNGRKDNIKIPDLIIKDRDFLAFCIRGIIDTDFCLTFKKKGRNTHYYPVISSSMKSKLLIKQLEKLLISLGFKPHTEYDYVRIDERFGKYKVNYLYLNGKENIEKWWKIIGTSNPKLKERYLFWKKNDYYPIKNKLN